MMKKIFEQRGFTLVELAIVLVIIGIILGAVIKGQDLIAGAKTKKFANKGREWELSQWTYLDRKGVFAGDADKDGKIGDGNVRTDMTSANLVNPPYIGTGGATDNKITMGSYSFFVFYGTVTDSAGNGSVKNVMILCKDDACSAFEADELIYLEAFDVAIDGSSDGINGQVVATATAPVLTAKAEWEATYAAKPTYAAWTADTSQALVYYFDSKK
jgi:prepilin-type N-terminal cleavage/methylation domain-containing protein